MKLKLNNISEDNGLNLKISFVKFINRNYELLRKNTKVCLIFLLNDETFINVVNQVNIL